MPGPRRWTHRVAVFERGRILEEGRPEQIFSAPITERTRDFLGHLQWH